MFSGTGTQKGSAGSAAYYLGEFEARCLDQAKHLRPALAGLPAKVRCGRASVVGTVRGIVDAEIRREGTACLAIARPSSCLQGPCYRPPLLHPPPLLPTPLRLSSHPPSPSLSQPFAEAITQSCHAPFLRMFSGLRCGATLVTIFAFSAREAAPFLVPLFGTRNWSACLCTWPPPTGGSFTGTEKWARFSCRKMDLVSVSGNGTGVTEILGGCVGRLSQTSFHFQRTFPQPPLTATAVAQHRGFAR